MTRLNCLSPQRVLIFPTKDSSFRNAEVKGVGAALEKFANGPEAVQSPGTAAIMAAPEKTTVSSSQPSNLDP